MAGVERWKRSNQRQVTDARDLLRRKYAAKQHKSPMHTGGQMKRFPLPNQPSNRFRNNNFRSSQNRRFQNRNGFRRPVNNFSLNTQNFQNRIRGASRFSVSRNNPTRLNRGGNRNKRVFASRGGITVTTANIQRNVVKGFVHGSGDDELESMSIDDIPGLNLPHSLSTNSSSRLFLSSGGPVNISNFPNLPTNTMVADSYVQNRERSSKLMVSDLLPSVSQEDIVELFSNIGPLVQVEIPAPGKAIIQYASAEAAEIAAESYDNVLLDGQAMRCHLLPSHDGRQASLASRLGGMSSSSAARQQSSSGMFLSSARISNQSSSGMFPSSASTSRSSSVIFPSSASTSQSISRASRQNVRFTVQLP